MVVLGQMRVQPGAEAAGQRRRVAHQLPADRERRARRRHHAQPAVPPVVVVGLDQPLRVGQDRLLALDEVVRRQPARRLAHAHAAPRGMEAHADLLRRLDLVVERDAVRVDVQVVRTRRAARQQQLGHGDLRRDLHHLRRQPGPDRVERLQPAEQLGVLRGRNGAGQRLDHVVVRVHQPRRDDVAPGVDHLPKGAHLVEDRRRHLARRVDRRDLLAADQQARAAQLAAGVIEGGDQVGLMDQQRAGQGGGHAHEAIVQQALCPAAIRRGGPAFPFSSS